MPYWLLKTNTCTYQLHSVSSCKAREQFHPALLHSKIFLLNKFCAHVILSSKWWFLSRNWRMKANDFPIDHLLTQIWWFSYIVIFWSSNTLCTSGDNLKTKNRVKIYSVTTVSHYCIYQPSENYRQQKYSTRNLDCRPSQKKCVWIQKPDITFSNWGEFHTGFVLGRSV